MLLSAIFGITKVAPPSCSAGIYGGSTKMVAPARLESGNGMFLECSSRPQKKTMKHHMMTRSLKSQGWDIRCGPTVYPPLSTLPPDRTLVTDGDTPAASSSSEPTIMMVGVQMALAGGNIFYKLAANRGMSLKVLVAYRFMFAALTVIPLALILERRERPKLTWRIVFLAFLVALFGGSMAQNLYAESLALTSATFVAAVANLGPAITFILAILFRLEKLGLNTKAGKAKVVGTFMGIGGAMLLTFYKGFEINLLSIHLDLLKNNKHQIGHVTVSQKTLINQILGPLLALASCFSFSFSLILQDKMSKVYPCHYSSTALVAVMGTIQAFIYALSMERNWNQWKLGRNLTLLSAAYMGIVVSGLMWTCQICCVRMRGPVFVSVFNPLLLVLVALAGSLLLNEKLYLGSVIGAVIIVLGLYTVLWGKSEEIKRNIEHMPTKNIMKEDQTNNIPIGT